MVFSPVYVDALVLRDRDTDSNGTLDERLWVQQDANFNVTALLDNSGAVVERYMYDPYGAATVLTPTWGTRTASLYGWVSLHQGGRLVASAERYHFRKRDYSPSLARWQQNDPLGFRALDTNLYRALANNPVRYTDPTGEIVPFVWIGAIAVGVIFALPGPAQAPANSNNIIVNPPFGSDCCCCWFRRGFLVTWTGGRSDPICRACCNST